MKIGLTGYVTKFQKHWINKKALAFLVDMGRFKNDRNTPSWG